MVLRRVGEQPQPHESNYTESYTTKIVSSCPTLLCSSKAEAAVPDRCLFYGSQLCATSDLAPLEQTNSVLDPDTGVSISYDNVNLVPLS